LKSQLGHGLAAQPSGENGMRGPLQLVRANVITTHRPHVGRRGGTLTGGSAVARRRQSVARDLEGGTGEVPGKEERAGAHRNGVPTVRRCKRHRAAAFSGGGVAPVVIDERGEVL
jgi:hypothetical protein